MTAETGAATGTVVTTGTGAGSAEARTRSVPQVGRTGTGSGTVATAERLEVTPGLKWQLQQDQQELDLVELLLWMGPGSGRLDV